MECGILTLQAACFERALGRFVQMLCDTVLPSWPWPSKTPNMSMS